MRALLFLAALATFAGCVARFGFGDDPCEDVTCSGHGECRVSGDEATCRCDSGYERYHSTQCAHVGGECETIADCDDGTLCTDDSCDPDLGCVWLDNTASCEDGDLCTEGDTCAAGVCGAGSPVSCTSLDSACSSGACDPLTGDCEATALNEGGTCSDGDLCSAGDRCVSGDCLPTGSVNCSGLDDDCVSGVCNPGTGACGPTPVNQGGACNDSDACTSTSTCDAGVCEPGPADKDVDVDGHVDDACPGGDDCNDGEGNESPALTEGPSEDATCSDGYDNDCDGGLDNADDDCDTCAELGGELCTGTEICLQAPLPATDAQVCCPPGRCLTIGTKKLVDATPGSPDVGDGSKAEWAGTPQPIAGGGAVAGDFAPQFQVQWDSTGIYVLVEVDDNVLCAGDDLTPRDTPYKWNYDSVEVYLSMDLGDNATTPYGDDENWAYIDLAAANSTNPLWWYPWDPGPPPPTSAIPGQPTPLITFQHGTAPGNDWWVELHVAWPGGFPTPVAGDVVGFDVVGNDDDGCDGARDQKLYWNDGNTYQWQTRFGLLQLQ